jgi:SAM-dependent methyltransferase
MRINPPIDLEFKYSSPFLKQVLARFKDDFLGHECLDLPCGNGRNTFLLASIFKKVRAIDNNQDYLTAINTNKPKHNDLGFIETIPSDLLTEPLKNIEQYKLFCNIHFFNEELITRVLSSMQKKAYLLVETPACHGQNFTTLPNEEEVKQLFSSYNTLMYEFKVCRNLSNTAHRGFLKILIQN